MTIKTQNATLPVTLVAVSRIFRSTTVMGAGDGNQSFLYLIRNNINRFGLLQKAMPLISKKVLTHQFRDLEVDGLVSRTVLEAKHPQVVVYHLTEKGRSLRALIDDMINWGLLNLHDAVGKPHTQ